MRYRRKTLLVERSAYQLGELCDIALGAYSIDWRRCVRRISTIRANSANGISARGSMSFTSRAPWYQTLAAHAASPRAARARGHGNGYVAWFVHRLAGRSREGPAPSEETPRFDRFAVHVRRRVFSLVVDWRIRRKARQDHSDLDGDRPLLSGTP